MKKLLKKESGSVAVLVIMTILSFFIFATGIYMFTSTRRQSQLKSDIELKNIYENDVKQANEVYESIVEQNTVYQENFDTWNNELLASTIVNSCRDGILNITSTTDKPSIVIGPITSFNPMEHHYIQVIYKASGTTQNKMAFYTVENPTNQDYYIEKELVCDTNWHTLVFDLWENEKIKNQDEITNLKWEWCNKTETTMEIDSIKIF